MESCTSTHLSADEIHAYLLGNPALPLRTAVEKHCLQCPKCLEDMCALTARIDKIQLTQEPVVAPVISSIPGSLVPVPRRLPVLAWQGGGWQGWASRAIAASLVLLVVPDSFRLVSFDRLLDSQLTTTTLDLPFTREYPSSIALLAMTKVELESAPPTQLIIARPKPQKQFLPPQENTRSYNLVQVALVDAPNLKFSDDSIDPLPKELEVTPAVAPVSKPNIWKRLFSAIAAPFRSPRT